MKSHDCYRDPITVRFVGDGFTETTVVCRASGAILSESREELAPALSPEELRYRESVDAVLREYAAAFDLLEASDGPVKPYDLELTVEAAEEIERRLAKPEALPTRPPRKVPLVEQGPFEPYASEAWQDGDGMDDVRRVAKVWNEAGERTEDRR